VAWAIPTAAGGIAGVVVVFTALRRRWAFGRQWIVLLGVVVVQAGVLALLSQAH
jgi:uncharacterized membrane protein HdeD (DUF308 family)